MAPKVLVISIIAGGALTLGGCRARPASARPRAAPTTKAGTADPHPTNAALEREVFELVNRHRRAQGLKTLALDARISRQARLHSMAMASGSTSLGHHGFADRVQALRRDMTFRRSAENVGMNQGYRDPAAQALAGWLASRGHRENIEGPYESTGIGVASDAAGNVYFTQIFVGR